MFIFGKDIRDFRFVTIFRISLQVVEMAQLLQVVEMAQLLNGLISETALFERTA